MRTIQEQKNIFFSRWGFSPVEIDQHEELEYLKLTLIKFLECISHVNLENTGYNLRLDELQFSIYFPKTSIKHSGTQDENLKTISLLITETKTIHELLYTIKCLFNHVFIYYVYEQNSYNSEFQSEDIFFNKNTLHKTRKPLQVLLESRSINVRVIFNEIDEHTVEIDFYPRGSKLLDNKLVDEVIPHLLDNSRVQYGKALKFYLEKDYESAANQLRKTLESWLKSVLGIDNTLDKIFDKLANEIKNKLSYKIKEKHGTNRDKANCQIAYISTFVSLTFPSLIELFKKYEIPHNEAGYKHANANVVTLVDAEFEFMLYQTGAIIRLIKNVLDADI